MILYSKEYQKYIKTSKVYQMKADISTLTCVFLMPFEEQDHAIPHYKALISDEVT